MPLSSTKDLDIWMARLADGDRSVFPCVFNAMWPPVRRMCQSLLRNEADAEDGAQQAMLKIMARASDYDPSRSALAWALRIAAWECRTLQRKRQRRREISLERAPGETPAPLDTLRTDGFTPERLSQEHELSNALRVAMEELSPMDRNELLAAFFDEARYENVSTTAQRKRRQRAIQRLRGVLRRTYDLG